MKSDWCSPKEIAKLVEPHLKNEYSDDTLNRLIRRSLKDLVKDELILKHKLQPLYHHSDYISILNSEQSAYSMIEFMEKFGIANQSLGKILGYDLTSIPILSKRTVQEKKKTHYP